MRVRFILLATLVAVLVAVPVLAGFAGTDVFLPMVGRNVGVYPSNWYTTVWIYNPQAAMVTARLYFLERNKVNLAAPWVDVTVAGGATEKFENPVEALFHVPVFGAIRVTAPEKIVVTSRVYSKVAGTGEQQSMGQDFAGVPASFAIGLNEKTQILGCYQTLPTGDSEFRYNFGLVETTGHTATVKVTARDSAGIEQGSTSILVREYSQKQMAFKDYFPTVSTENTRLEIEVTAGSGKVIGYGSGVANVSQDPTTYEMTYKDSLLGGGGLSGVAHDTTLIGDGTAGAPLGLAPGAVTMAKISSSGASVGKVIKYNGSSVVWGTDSTGIVLPYSGSIGTGVGTDAFSISNSSTGRAMSLWANSDTALWTNSTSGAALDARSGSNTAVRASSTSGVGVDARSTSGVALIASSDSGDGIDGAAKTAGKSGVYGHSNVSGGFGVYGRNFYFATRGYLGGTYEGVAGYVDGPGGAGVRGEAFGVGVEGKSANDGVRGEGGVAGVKGRAIDGGRGVEGICETSNGQYQSLGVYGESQDPVGIGVFGSGTTGVRGEGDIGVKGVYQGVGLYSGILGTEGYAGYFNGPAYFSGYISKPGGGFQIDHPLDPENRVLNHSFVESPDMMNIYNGNVTTDAQGSAVVELPAWFEALNQDFRYQLTVIGRFAQAIIEQKVDGNRFVIRTNLANIEVSWQVTGIRKDTWANANRVVVEQNKPAAERGTYLHPEAYGYPETMSVERVRHPEDMRAIKKAREAPKVQQQ